MKNAIKSINLPLSIMLCIICFGSITGSLAQDDAISQDLISPIYGKLMLTGTGELTARTQATFALLAGEGEGRLVVLAREGSRRVRTTPNWEKQIGSVEIFYLNKTDNELSGKVLIALREANAVWLVDDLSKNFQSVFQLVGELNGLLHRNGIIGGQGVAAESMGALIIDNDEIREGLDLLPNSIISSPLGTSRNFSEVISKLPGRLGWELPPQASVVIHSGRQISVIEYPEITLRIAANGEWPERVTYYGPPIDDLPYTEDLISWNRSALARLNDKFPPSVAPIPEVLNGALIIVGGSGFPDGMWERVIDFAGGTDANYVCFSQTSASTGAERLRELGCRNISVYMVKTGVEGIGQGNDPQLLKALENADCVYFGGGRTYKFMDAYHNTEAHLLMHKVLERGGIILGGSAGAQIQGDFLVRGDPRTNNELWMEGNDVGLGFINGVIIDAHFRERGREKTLPSLLVRHPQMLGIGIDETTAIFVQGTTAEVMGPHTVTFYDLTEYAGPGKTINDIGHKIVLMAGEKYDLKLRKKVANTDE